MAVKKAKKATKVAVKRGIKSLVQKRREKLVKECTESETMKDAKKEIIDGNGGSFTMHALSSWIEQPMENPLIDSWIEQRQKRIADDKQALKVGSNIARVQERGLEKRGLTRCKVTRVKFKRPDMISAVDEHGNSYDAIYRHRWTTFTIGQPVFVGKEDNHHVVVGLYDKRGNFKGFK